MSQNELSQAASFVDELQQLSDADRAAALASAGVDHADLNPLLSRTAGAHALQHYIRATRAQMVLGSLALIALLVSSAYLLAGYVELRAENATLTASLTAPAAEPPSNRFLAAEQPEASAESAAMTAVLDDLVSLVRPIRTGMLASFTPTDAVDTIPLGPQLNAETVQ